MKRNDTRLTRPLLTRTEALALALLLGMPIAADAFSDDVEDPEPAKAAVAPAPELPTPV